MRGKKVSFAQPRFVGRALLLKEYYVLFVFELC